jgi:hypothetical protein
LAVCSTLHLRPRPSTSLPGIRRTRCIPERHSSRTKPTFCVTYPLGLRFETPKRYPNKASPTTRYTQTSRTTLSRVSDASATSRHGSTTSIPLVSPSTPLQFQTPLSKLQPSKSAEVDLGVSGSVSATATATVSAPSLGSRIRSSGTSTPH